MQPEPYNRDLSLASCQAACEAYNTCEGVVMEKRHAASSGTCYLRKNIQLSGCKTGGSFNLYIRSHQSQMSDQGNTTLSLSLSPSQWWQLIHTVQGITFIFSLTLLCKMLYFQAAATQSISLEMMSLETHCPPKSSTVSTILNRTCMGERCTTNLQMER